MPHPGHFILYIIPVMINGMEQLVVSIALALLGVSIGSFNGATVWRLRARQLRTDKHEGEKVNAGEYKQLKQLLKAPLHKDRSQCLHCHHTLRWYDLLPLISWAQLKGRCRYCHKPIGKMEPLVEIGTAVIFVASYLFWPYSLATSLEITQFILWLVAVSGLIILFVYDAKWFLLPDRIVFPLMVVAGLSAAIHIGTAAEPIAAALSAFVGCAILSGLYLLLFILSRGAWIGFGDIKLGLVLALLVADWKLAFLTLFAANLIGCILVIPGLLSRKLNHASRVPFGPMLIAACILVMLFGHTVISWYLSGVFL